jgi:ribonuclease PH
MNEAGKFVEIRGTAEGAPLNSDQLQMMLALARKGASELIEHQKAFLEEFG